MLFGLLLTVIGGQMASMASNHMGSPNTDLLYDLLSWSSTLGALGGLCAFFWGAKEFAQVNRSANDEKETKRDV